MVKAKMRSLKRNINNKYTYMTRESALDFAVKHFGKKESIDTITLFGFSAEEMLEAGAEYEDILSLGGLVK